MPVKLIDRAPINKGRLFQRSYTHKRGQNRAASLLPLGTRIEETDELEVASNETLAAPLANLPHIAALRPLELVQQKTRLSIGSTFIGGSLTRSSLFRILFLKKQRSVVVPVFLETHGEGGDVLVGDMPRDAAVDFAIAVSDEIPEASNLSPRIIREGGYDAFRKVDSVFSDAIDRTHHGIVGQLPIIRAIIHELLSIKGEALDTSRKRLRVVKDDAYEIEIALKLLHKVAPHHAARVSEKPGA